MLAVPGMTVTAPKDADELVGLLRTALQHDGPFSTRYPRDKAPVDPNPIGSIPPVPYGTWEMLRAGQDVAILGTGTMALAGLAAAELLETEGIDVAAVNARFIKPLDEAMLFDLAERCRVLVTVEEGTVVNGFGAMLAARLERSHPQVRVITLGIPDALIMQAARPKQLELYGLTPQGIAAEVRTALRESVVS
jgi:1-deoxy-D-xylulose-5-phosphate synthase